MTVAKALDCPICADETIEVEFEDDLELIGTSQICDCLLTWEQVEELEQMAFENLQREAEREPDPDRYRDDPRDDPRRF